MGWRMKAILDLLIVLEAVNCAQLSLKDARIDDLEGQQIINRSRLENWQTRAMRDEQTIEDLQKAADEAEIALPDCLRQIKRPRSPISARVNVRCVYYMKTARRVDLANLIEATTDILVKARVLEDDNSKIVSAHDGSRVELDRKNPRVEIEIKEMER